MTKTSESKYVVREFRRDALEPFHESKTTPEIAKWLERAENDSQPLDIEIGCGVGWHPIQYAEQNTDRNLIAIEHTRAKFERFQSRVQRHPELTNLLPVHADAIRWVAHNIPASKIDRYFLLYPNPEPKAPNRRWLRSPFMHYLLETLKPGGELVLATNEIWYMEEACNWAENAWNLGRPKVRELSLKELKTFSPRTHFEKKYLEREQTCFDVTWVKPLK
jgi:tRNA (guanine-N7-)-methyltransferase